MRQHHQGQYSGHRHYRHFSGGRLGAAVEGGEGGAPPIRGGAGPPGAPYLPTPTAGGGESVGSRWKVGHHPSGSLELLPATIHHDAADGRAAAQEGHPGGSGMDSAAGAARGRASHHPPALYPPFPPSVFPTGSAGISPSGWARGFEPEGRPRGAVGGEGSGSGAANGKDLHTAALGEFPFLQLAPYGTCQRV